MAMSKKNYNDLAAMLAAVWGNAQADLAAGVIGADEAVDIVMGNVVGRLEQILGADNPRFDAGFFRTVVRAGRDYRRGERLASLSGRYSG